MSEPEKSADEWCEQVAGLAVGALLEAGLLPSERLEDAKVIIATEISVRLYLNDYPPQLPDVEPHR